MSFILRAVYDHCVRYSVNRPWYVPRNYGWDYARRCVLLQLWMESKPWILKRVPRAIEIRERREEFMRFIRYITTMTIDEETRTFH